MTSPTLAQLQLSRQDRLKAFLEEKQITQRQIASELGWKESYLSRLLYRSKKLSPVKVAMLHDRYGIPLELLPEPGYLNGFSPQAQA